MTLEQKLKNLYSLKKLAWGVTALGFAISAGGNVLHAHKTTIGVAIAVVPPILLFAAFELVSRVPLRPEAHWVGKWARVLATGAIAAIMFIVSWRAQHDALLAYTGDHATAVMLPGAIDAVMVVGSVTLLELGVQILNLEAYIAGGAVKTSTAKPKVEEVPPVKKDEPPSKKEAIAAVIARSPELSVKDVAKLTGSSYNYTHAIVGELRKMSGSPVTV